MLMSFDFEFYRVFEIRVEKRMVLETRSNLWDLHEIAEFLGVKLKVFNIPIRLWPLLTGSAVSVATWSAGFKVRLIIIWTR